MQFWGKRGSVFVRYGGSLVLIMSWTLSAPSGLTKSRSSQILGSISIHFLHQALLFSLSLVAYGQMIWNAGNWTEATEVGLQQYKSINERMQSNQSNKKLKPTDQKTGQVSRCLPSLAIPPLPPAPLTSVASMNLVSYLSLASKQILKFQFLPASCSFV